MLLAMTGSAFAGMEEAKQFLDKEVGDMSERFLTEFSKPQSNKSWQDIMRDFKASACPDPREVDGERDDVIRHYSNFFMNSYQISAAQVTTTVAIRWRRDVCMPPACGTSPSLCIGHGTQGGHPAG